MDRDSQKGTGELICVYYCLCFDLVTQICFVYMKPNWTFPSTFSCLTAIKLNTL